LKSYSAILDYLKERGYTVIRLGEYEKQDGISKYNYLELTGLGCFERDLLNVFISSVCSIFLGSASGASDLATIWNRPVFRINVLPYSFLRPHSKKGMAIPKLLKKNGAILSASQIFGANYHWLRDDASYERNGIQIENNAPLDCLPDFIEFFKSFVDEDYSVYLGMAQSFQQKVYEQLCSEDSYDYRAQSIVPRFYFQKWGIV
jgi:putative glycosyltransferase (TIGR04372 family)